MVVHNTYRGSTTYRNRVSINANGSGGSDDRSDSIPASTSRGGGKQQACGGKRRGGGAGRARGGSVAQRTSRALSCQFPGCSKPASYGDGSTPTRCAGHKEKGQIDHKHRSCESVTPKPCLKQPSFGWPGESRKRFCGTHRRPGTVDLRNCEHEGCGTRASHGFGTGRARFCAAHSPPGTSVLANKVWTGAGGAGRQALASSQKRKRNAVLLANDPVLLINRRIKYCCGASVDVLKPFDRLHF